MDETEHQKLFFSHKFIITTRLYVISSVSGTVYVNIFGIINNIIIFNFIVYRLSYVKLGRVDVRVKSISQNVEYQIKQK